MYLSKNLTFASSRVPLSFVFWEPVLMWRTVVEACSVGFFEKKSYISRTYNSRTIEYNSRTIDLRINKIKIICSFFMIFHNILYFFTLKVNMALLSEPKNTIIQHKFHKWGTQHNTAEPAGREIFRYFSLHSSRDKCLGLLFQPILDPGFGVWRGFPL